jgi:hypothetical protein
MAQEHSEPVVVVVVLDQTQLDLPEQVEPVAAVLVQRVKFKRQTEQLTPAAVAVEMVGQIRA